MPQDDLATELTALVLASEKLLSLTEKLERSPVIDKAFAKEMAALAAQTLAHARQAALEALP